MLQVVSMSDLQGPSVKDSLGNMQLKRTFDSAFLNKVANDPSVRPFIGGEGELDVSPQVKTAQNFTFVNDFGGVIGVCLEPGIYEVHSQFLPEGRNAQLVEEIRRIIAFGFIESDFTQIITKVPQENRAALGLARSCFFTPLWEAPAGTRIYGLGLDHWAESHGPALRAGQELHALFESEGFEHGGGECKAHLWASGAAWLMVQAGNVQKGVAYYNRWARISNYPQITILSLAPWVLDLGGGFVCDRNGRVPCQ